MGASYGSLFATKALMARHRVTLVCTASTAELIGREGTCVRFPSHDGGAPLEIASKALPGVLTALAPEAVAPHRYDLVVLGMQESHYCAPGVRDLIVRIADARRPSLAIMNMPPLAYLKRIPGLDIEQLRGCYAEASVWEAFEPGLVTLASPDPQASRLAGEAKNVLQVGLPTNFKAARFESVEHTAMLVQLAQGIEEARLLVAGEHVEVPVKLKVHDSLFVPLAKWPMLIAGNYRCIRRDEMIPIKEAVHADVAKSREVYNWVVQLCRRLGAGAADLVPFEKYAKAAESLGKPSSAARALFSGAHHIERIDSLVDRIAGQLALHSEVLREIVLLVDERLAANRVAGDARRAA